MNEKSRHFLERVRRLPPDKLGILTTELHKQLESLKEARDEPIAVIGLGCRLPGGVCGPEDLWRLLHDGVDATSEVPAERFDADAFYDPRGADPAKMYTRRGGFLGPVDGFDAPFFNISPREARLMDPQQRLLLEVAWETFEHAGRAPDEARNGRVGVFVGISNNDYSQLLYRRLDPAQADAYIATGNALSFAAGRLAFFFGWNGPGIALDTACSSSLVAVHLACQALRQGDCRLALAAGVNLTLIPATWVMLCRSRALAFDGRCKTFDAAADGYARGEGCGAVLLKRLSAARADGDRIIALLRATAVNQDGASSGPTVPNAAAQEALVREALRRAGVKPSELGYLEAHGTGTPLGDPIELRALSAALDGERDVADPLLVGSVKTNLGHLESAAGVVGLIKVILAASHGEVPAHLHFRQPNPHLDWPALPLRVANERQPWPERGGRRIGGVSSFGFSGTNAHAVVEATPAEEVASLETSGPGGSRPELLALSAKDPAALEALTGRWRERLATTNEPARDICATAAVGRAHFAHRRAVLGASAAELAAALAAPDLLEGHRRLPTSPKIAFLFTGQGAQYPGMGRELYGRDNEPGEPVYRQTIDDCAAVLDPLLERPLLEILHGGAEITSTALAQPALVAHEYALFKLFESWGIEPTALLGHSVGEYVAACAAGILSLEDGLRLVAERGRLMGSLPPGGGMLSVALGEEEAQRYLEAEEDPNLALAAVNGPGSVVLSGPDGTLDRLAERLLEAGIEGRRLEVSHAFHSPLLEPVLDDFEAAADVPYGAPRYAVISNVSGREAHGDELASAAYWRRQARQPVRFFAGLESLVALDVEIFLEIGPHPVLCGLGRRALGEDGMTWIPTLHRERRARTSLLTTLGRLYVGGAEIDWQAMAGTGFRRLALPTYPFQRQSCWLPEATAGTSATPEVGSASAAVAAAPSPSSLPADPAAKLLGRRLASPLWRDERVFEARWDAAELSLLAEHRLYDLPVVTGALHLGTAATLVTREWEAGAGLEVEELRFEQPLILPTDEPRTVQTVLRPVGGAGEPAAVDFELFSRPAKKRDDESADDRWKLHTAGRFRLDCDAEPAAVELEAVRERCDQEISGADFYARFWQRDRHYIGPAFQLVERLWRRRGEALVELRPPGDEVPTSLRQSATIEACGQVLKVTLPETDWDQVFLGFGLDRSRGRFDAPTAARWCHARLREGGDAAETAESFAGDLRLLDEEGRVVAEVEGLRFRRVPPQMLRRALERAVQPSQPVPRDLLERAPEEVRQWLVDYLRRQVGRAAGLPATQIDPAAPLEILGMDSLMAVELVSWIEADLGDLGIELDPAHLGRAQSLEEVALALWPAGSSKVGAPAAEAASPGIGSSPAVEDWLRRPRPRPEAELRLFCLPYGGAGASIYRLWPAGLPATVEVCAVQLPGREERFGEPRHERFDPLLDALEMALVPAFDRPYAIFGCSLGGLLAFELARRLEARGQGPREVMIAAFPSPERPIHLFDELRHKGALEPGPRLDALLGDDGPFTVSEKVRRDPELFSFLLEILRADLAVLDSYDHQPGPPLHCPLTVFGGDADELVGSEDLAAWHRHTRVGFQMRLFKGPHLFMESRREELLEVIGRRLQEAAAVAA